MRCVYLGHSWLYICVLNEGGIEQVWAGLSQRLALAMSYSSSWRSFCPEWAEALVSRLGTQPSFHSLLMICPPLHLSGGSRFTPQPLGPFSVDIGAKHQWIYKKQLTEPYSWHPFLFFTASAVREFFAYFYFSFAVVGSDSGSLAQTTLSGFSPSPSSVFLSAWQIATCSLRIISPSCTFPTLVSKLLKRLMSAGAWIVTLDICHRANAKCMACVQYQKAKGCSVRGKRKCFLYSVWHGYLEICF